MEILNTIMGRLRQGYSKIQLIAIIGLVVFIFFVSDSNIFALLGYESQINDLNKQIEYYRKKTEVDKEQLKLLQSDKENIEKFARENFLMKKENEDIFIIE